MYVSPKLRDNRLISLIRNGYKLPIFASLTGNMLHQWKLGHLMSRMRLLNMLGVGNYDARDESILQVIQLNLSALAC